MRHLFTLIAFTICSAAFAQTNKLMVYNLRPEGGGSVPCFFTEFMDRLYFVANDEVHGFELWSLGKTDPPKMIADLYSGKASGGTLNGSSGTNTEISSFIRHMAVLKDGEGRDKMLYLQGNDGTKGWELYKYDPSMPAPVIAYDLVPGVASFSNSFLFRGAVAVSNKIYFASLAGSTSKIIAYDPSLNTFKVIDSNKVFAENVTAYNSRLYYSIQDTLLSIDPLTNTVTRIANYPGGGSKIHYMHVVAGKLYFGLLSGAGGMLYEYDGSHPPMNVVGYCQGSTPGDNNMSSWTIGEHKGKVYFPCSDNGVCRPCEYDPVSKNVTKLGAACTTPNCFISCAGKLFFSAFEPTHGFELWSYNGVNPPIMEMDILPGTAGSDPMYLTAYKDELYFGASHAPEGYELLRYAPGGLFPGSVSNLMFTGKVNIFPNPATKQCTIALELITSATLTVRLYDATGRVVYTNDAKQYAVGKHDIQLDMHDLPAAMYHMQLLDSNGALLYTSKIVKQ